MSGPPQVWIVPAAGGWPRAVVQHGANDTNVPVVEAEPIADTMKARGVPVENLLFPDEGHGWRTTPNRVKSTTGMVEFLPRDGRRAPGALSRLVKGASPHSWTFAPPACTASVSRSSPSRLRGTFPSRPR